MFVDHTVFYDIWSHKVSKTTNVIINWVCYRPPTAHFCFTAPLEFLTAPKGAVPPTKIISSYVCRDLFTRWPSTFKHRWKTI